MNRSSLSDRPDLSIIIVTYNGADLLRLMLRSVLYHTHSVSFEIIVIDNASPNRGIEQIPANFPTVRFIFRRHNDGYATANNIGIRISTGRYVALVNPDTELHDNLFTMLVQWLDVHPDVGAVGPQLLQPNGKPQPYSHGFAPTPWYVLRRVWLHSSGSYLHTWHGDVPQDVDWVAGTCLVARRSALEQVGGLDERFFLYFEDVDLGIRLRRSGWRVVFLPIVSLIHTGGGSVGRHTHHWYDRSLTHLYAKYHGGLAAASVWWLLRLYRWIQGKRLL